MENLGEEPKKNAYQLMDYCPMDGKKLTLVKTPIDDIKQCDDHPLVLFPSYVNEHGEQVMVFDPNRPGRV